MQGELELATGSSWIGAINVYDRETLTLFTVAGKPLYVLYSRLIVLAITKYHLDQIGRISSDRVLFRPLLHVGHRREDILICQQ